MSSWMNTADLGSRQYVCGYCGNKVASNVGYFHKKESSRRVVICPHCENPSYFDALGTQIPGVAPGGEVKHVPKELSDLYTEARNCCRVGAYTASVLAARKMLMNIGVQQGAKAGLSFLEYVDHLASNGFIPPNGKGWVDHIRKKGNEATHEIALMKNSDAEELLILTEMLLKFIYEFPQRVPPAKP